MGVPLAALPITVPAWNMCPVCVCVYIYTHTHTFMGFPCDSAGKESACNTGDLALIPGLGRSPGEGKDYLLQYSGLENSMGCTVHGTAESQTRLSYFHFNIYICICIYRYVCICIYICVCILRALPRAGAPAFKLAR